MKFRDEHHIAGRGIVLTFDMESGDRPISVGDTIYHQGHFWEVVGIEMSRGLTDPSIIKPGIGLVVKRKD